MTNAIFEATYADFKLVKTRKVAQFVYEVPIERVNQVLEMTGMPDSSKEEWYAIARLVKQNNGPASQQTAPEDHTPPAKIKWDDMPYTQRANILYDDKDFAKYVMGDARQYILRTCGVTSSTEIKFGSEEARKFDLMVNAFRHAQKYGEQR